LVTIIHYHFEKNKVIQFFLELTFPSNDAINAKSYKEEFGKMKKVPLGNTGLEVTELCFGTLPMGRLQARLSPAEGAMAVRRALELGINFFDTAKTYGSYPHLREALDGWNDEVIIATKSKAATYDNMEKDVHSALEELNIKRIGVFHLHQVRSKEDFSQRQGALECLLDYQKRGIIQSIGISAHTPGGVKALLDCPDIEVIMPIINKDGLGIIDGTLEEMVDAVKAAAVEGKSLYAMKPLGGGHLIKQIPEAINYIRNLGVFDAISVGMKTPDEVEMTARIVAGQFVPQRLLDRIKTAVKHLIIYDSCKACGICEETCDQGAIKVEGKKAKVDQEKCILCGYCAASCPVFCIRVA